MKEIRIKILVILLMCCAIAILFDAITSKPTYKYRIISESHGYRTDKYKTVGPNCIKFVDRHNQTITICGEYEIIENK
jgi:hypothetical protein